MGAYDYMDAAIAGLKVGLISKVEGGWVCAESLGIPYGRPVFGHIGNSKEAFNYKNDVSKIVISTDFITGNSTIVTVDGVATSAIVFDTDHDTTVAALVAAIAGLTGVEAQLDATDVDNLTILIQKKTKSFVTDDVTAVTTLGATQPTYVITYGSSQVFLGVSLFVQKASSLDVSTNQGYEQYEPVAVMSRGQIHVPVGAAVAANNEAYVLTSGDDLGKFGASGLAIDSRYKGNAASGGLAIAEVNGQTETTYADEFAE